MQPRFSFLRWPKGLTQRPEDLIAAGLIYTGKGDECRCTHCNVILSGWKRDESPLKKHFEVQPLCLVFSLNPSFSPDEADEESHDQEHDDKSSSLDGAGAALSTGNGNRSISTAAPAEGAHLAVDFSDDALGGESSKSRDANEAASRLDDELVCKVCFDGVIEVAHLPCAHAFACRRCALRVQQCAMCNSQTKSLVRTRWQ